MDERGNTEAHKLDVGPVVPLLATDSPPFLSVKEELPYTITVPAEDRVIRVPRRL